MDLVNVISAGIVGHAFGISGVSDLTNNIVSGMGLGLSIAVAFPMINYRFAKRSTSLKRINIDHAKGAVIGAALSFQI